MIEQLNLARSRKSVLILIRQDFDDAGLTTRVTDDLFIVAVNSRQNMKDLGLTLAHELVHVKQMAKGQLRTVGGKTMWAGKPYKPSTEYLQRPWEIQAFSRQELILRRALNAKI